MLRDHRQFKPRPAQPFTLERAEIGVAEPNLARDGLHGPGDATQQRSLAAAVAAEHDDKLARLDGQFKVDQARACRSGSAATRHDAQHRQLPPEAISSACEIDVERLYQIADQIVGLIGLRRRNG